MRVKIIASTNGLELEDEINSFIQDKRIIDIKYSSFHLGALAVNDRVLIMYEDDETPEVLVN